MAGLQGELAGDYETVAADWPGFGTSPKPRVSWTPEAMAAWLDHLLGSFNPAPSLIVAAGHAAGYVLRHGAEGAGRLPHVVLVAPTWRGPLPTVLGGRPGWLGAVRGAIDAPGLGHAFYRANLNDRMVRRMAQGHVYSDPDWLTEERLAGKRGVTRARGARFASVRFVTGRLDPFATGEEARAAAAAVSAERLQWIWGEEAPRRSKAEMEALAEAAGGAPVVLPRGKLALHEEFPQEVARVIAEG
jgi:pimeloyl-ACP methyl ester carboxylesterase